MSVEQNKLIMYQMIEEIWTKGHLEVADELFAADHTSPSAPDLPAGPVGVKFLVNMFHEAMPDYQMSIDMIVADEDQVAARFIQSGTHTGEDLMGMEASGRRAEWTEIGVLKIKNGKIVESWYEADMLSMIQQLSAGPTKEEMKKILGRISEEVWVKGNYDAVYELFSPDLIDHNPLPGLAADREGYRQATIALRTAFPDLKVSMLHQLAEGDLAVDHWEGTATHIGDFLGVPATGKSIKLVGFNLGRLNDDGLIIERWSQFDSMDLMRQLGVMPGVVRGSSNRTIPKNGADGFPTIDEIHSVIQRYIEQIWNLGDVQTADKLVHAEAIAPYMPDLPLGPSGLKAYVTGFRNAFPDLHFEVEQQVIDGNMVAILSRITGTHMGDFMGMEPTGNSINFQTFSVIQIVDGKIIATWAVADMLTLIQQIQSAEQSD